MKIEAMLAATLLIASVAAADCKDGTRATCSRNGCPGVRDCVGGRQGLAVGLTDPHAAKANGRNFQIAVSKFALLHMSPSDSFSHQSSGCSGI